MRLVGLVVALAFYAGAPTWERGNDLALAYGKWAELRNERMSSPLRQGTVSIPERLAWREVKSRWRSLESSVDFEYSGR